MNRQTGSGFFLLLLITFATPVFAQDLGQALTLDSAVSLALKNYPVMRLARAQAASAEAGVQLARTAYLPRADIVWQENRATRNNVFGLLLPQSTVPSISGPVLETTANAGAWGSAGGMLVSWEPIDFGVRKANVELARALRERANAGIELTEIDVSAGAADAYLVLAAANQTVRAARANVDRMEVFARSVHALVDNQLRPGADASRADAELAAARTQLIQAQQSEEISRANLAESLGLAGVPLAIRSDDVLRLPPDVPTAAVDVQSHPLARAQSSSIDAIRARERALDRALFPHLNYQFAVFGRGSGALLDGRIDPSKGLVPNVFNWATGISVTFPTLDIFAVRARKNAEESNEAAERARYDQVLQGLKARDARAQASMNAARKVAENTPVQVQAARETDARARARYDAALGNILEVAEAQRLLTQSEIEDAVARVNVWRALLDRYKVRGDIQPFLRLVRSGTTE